MMSSTVEEQVKQILGDKKEECKSKYTVKEVAAFCMQSLKRKSPQLKIDFILQWRTSHPKEEWSDPVPIQEALESLLNDHIITHSKCLDDWFWSIV